MKKLLLLFLLISYNNLFSQVILESFDSKRMKAFLDSKTLFVLTGDKTFDDQLKLAVPKYWKVTPYDFISKDDVEKKQMDESFSFFLFNEFKSTVETRYDRINGGLSKNYEVIYTLMAGGKKLDRYNTQGQQLAYITVDLGGNMYDMSYRIEYAIKGVNDGLQTVTSKNIKGSDEKVEDAVFDNFSLQANVLKQKTLLIDKSYAFDMGKHFGKMVDVDEMKKHNI